MLEETNKGVMDQVNSSARPNPPHLWMCWIKSLERLGRDSSKESRMLGLSVYFCYLFFYIIKTQSNRIWFAR